MNKDTITSLTNTLYRIEISYLLWDEVKGDMVAFLLVLISKGYFSIISSELIQIRVQIKL